MSIFISDLAFAEELTKSWSKIAILVASLSSGLIGYCMIRRTQSKP
jgi:Na+/H+ antiporter NhaA